MLPVPKELDLFAEAVGYLDRGVSFRDVAAWLSHKAGRHLSHVCLYRRYKRLKERPQANPEAGAVAARLMVGP
jgi:hypothetical protein